MGIGGCPNGDKCASMHPWLHGSMALHAHLSLSHSLYYYASAAMRGPKAHRDIWENPPPPTEPHLTRRIRILIQRPIAGRSNRAPSPTSSSFLEKFSPKRLGNGWREFHVFLFQRTGRISVNILTSLLPIGRLWVFFHFLFVFT